MKVIVIFLFSIFGYATLNAQSIENWAQFRGPNGQGISSATGLPERWSATENITWKTPIPGEGWSSPIVWNNHIFLTTTTEEGKNCHVIAVDRLTGRILWDKIVFTQNTNQQRHDMNSYATPTPVTDGQLVYAVFSGGGMAALDFNGNVSWLNQQLDFYSQHGKSVSPILYGDMMILAVNHSNQEEGVDRRAGWQLPWDKSFLLALDKSTGRERWRTLRGMSRIAHSTPVIMQVNGRDQIISVVGDVIQGFNPSDGRLLWTVDSDGEPCVPTPAIGEGLIYSAPTGGAPIRAVRPTGQGNVTATHIAWERSHQNTTPMMSSFLYVKPYLYTCSNITFSCLDATTGDLLWQLPIRTGALNPSPVYADGKIYILSEQGTTTVLRPSNDRTTPAEIIATNQLDDPTTRGSMAVYGKQLFIRTANTLWCIGR
jgi:outer membrane protein assembly factor BamB